MLPEFHQSSEVCPTVNQLHQVNRQLGTRRGCAKDPIAARKVQKAGREKLRRDRLNEQFSVLGSVIDPDRPKNDKVTILTDAIRILRDLTAEVKQLKNEHVSLLDESRNLTQEKIEIREEKTTLKAEIEQLQNQFQQRVRALPSWSAMDPAMMMSAPAFSYPMSMQCPGSSIAPESCPTSPHGRVLPPFISVPVPVVTIPMHPSLQVYPIFGNRNTDGNNPYLAFAPYTPRISSHVKRPSARYPSPVQPLPECLLKRQPPWDGKLGSFQPQATVIRDHADDAPILFQDPSQTIECQKNGTSRASDLPHGHAVNVTVSSPSPNQGTSRSDFPDIMLTNLQLQIPASFVTSSQCQSNHSGQERGHKQDASSEVRKGKSSPYFSKSCHDRKSVQKAVPRLLSPSRSVQGASSSSNGDVSSTKSNKS